MTTATLLDGADWAGNIFVDGELATRVGRGRSDHRARDRRGARPHRPGRGRRRRRRRRLGAPRPSRSGPRCRTPQRAAVLRKAGDLFTEHAEELGGLERARGRRGPGHGRLRAARRAEECYAAAGLPGRSARRAAPERAAAAVDGQAGPGRRGRGDLAVQRAAHPEHPLGRPGAGPRQRGAAEARPAHGDDRRGEHRPGLRGGRAAAPACSSWCPVGADVGEALVADPHVRVISFTGSTEAGRAVGELAGRHLKRAHLELGGNSAMLVLDDADVEQAVNLAAWGSFFHQGQICMTTGRHLVARRDLRRLRRGAGRQGGPPAGRQPGHRAGRPRPGHRRGPARQDPRPGHGDAPMPAPRRPPVRRTTGCSTGPPCSPR